MKSGPKDGRSGHLPLVSRLELIARVTLIEARTDKSISFETIGP